MRSPEAHVQSFRQKITPFTPPFAGSRFFPPRSGGHEGRLPSAHGGRFRPAPEEWTKDARQPLQEARGERNKDSPLSSDTEIFSQQSVGGGRPQAHDHRRMSHFDFCFQPGTASPDLGIASLFVNASLPSFGRNPIEMLDYIGDINLSTVDSCPSKASSRIRPAGPTKGRPARSSRSTRRRN